MYLTNLLQSCVELAINMVYNSVCVCVVWQPFQASKNLDNSRDGKRPAMCWWQGCQQGIPHFAITVMPCIPLIRTMPNDGCLACFYSISLVEILVGCMVWNVISKHLTTLVSCNWSGRGHLCNYLCEGPIIHCGLIVWVDIGIRLMYHMTGSVSCINEYHYDVTHYRLRSFLLRHC